MLSLAFAVGLVSPSFGQVKGPTEVDIVVGRLKQIPLTIEGDESDYKVLGKDVDALREYDPDPKKLKLRVIGYAPGIAYVVIASAKDGKLQPIHTITVTIGGPAPPNPPGPTPPTPPVPPGPVDPFVAKLQAAFDKDTSDAAKKAEWKTALRGFYAAMADHVKDKGVTTIGDLLGDYRAAMPTLLPEGSIVELRRVCGLEVATPLSFTWSAIAA
jgi:hypothetical protein